MNNMNMRFVIVCLLKGELLRFHEKLINQLKFKFNINPQKLPTHFTIKAPFETNDENNLENLESVIENFCKIHTKSEMTIENFNHFNNKVVYMQINPSDESLKVNDEFINTLKQLPWLEWKRNETGKKVFHCTVATKFSPSIFNDTWNYVNNYNPNFKFYFDNITIMKWEKYKWKTYKEFKLS